MVKNPFQVLRKHWKKSIFFSTVAAFSIKYGYDYSLTRDVMRMNCRKASILGDQKVTTTTRPRHITVILNPTAGKRKSKTLYRKWVEPLLHLAGIKVSLVETERPDQARDLMKIMTNCDGVAIVGGDGTILEAISGLLERSDATRAVKELPIALMPTGIYNSIAKCIHQNLIYRNQKEFLIVSTMQLVDSLIEQHDVLSILSKSLENGNQLKHASQDTEKLTMISLRDKAFSFYQGAMKPLWLMFPKFFKNKFPNPDIESIISNEPCDGCSRCCPKHLLKYAQQADNEIQTANSRWWSRLAPPVRIKLNDKEKRQLELSKVDNPKCNNWLAVETTFFTSS